MAAEDPSGPWPVPPKHLWGRFPGLDLRGLEPDGPAPDRRHAVQVEGGGVTRHPLDAPDQRLGLRPPERSRAAVAAAATLSRAVTRVGVADVE